MQTGNTPSLQTSSFIQLSIPAQYQQTGSLSFVWTSFYTNPIKSFITKFILSQNKSAKITDLPYYICSPLDLGRFITLKVYHQTNFQKVLLQELKYGPVILQQNIFQNINFQKLMNVQVFFNKNIRKPAVISLNNTAENQIKSLAITIKIENFQYVIKLNEQIAKVQMQHYQRQSFFKIHESQQNSVGIYISHQAQQFIQKIKQIDVLYHFGHYLKLYFSNRMHRDVFVLHLASMINQQCQQFVKFRSSFKQYQQSKFTQNNAGNHHRAEMNIKNNQKNNISSSKIQGTIKHSNLLGLQLLNISTAQSEVPKIREEILEDIYNLLHNPISQIPKKSIIHNSEVSESPQRSIAEQMCQKLKKPPILFNNQIQSSISEGQSICKQQKQNQLKKLKSQDKKCRLPQNSQVYSLQKSVETVKNLKINPILNQSNKKIANEQRKNHHQQQNLKKGMFKKQLNQIDLLQKINQLTRFNEQLIYQNRILRQQNQRLKRQPNTLDKLNQISKMMEIKNMVQMMAKKLQQLQQQTEKSQKQQLLQQSRKFLKKAETFQQLPSKNGVHHRSRQLLHGNTKRVWNPKTHQQIVKNLRQRHPDDRNDYKKSYQKTNNLFLNQMNNMKYSPEPKLNNRVLKQCKSQGKIDLQKNVQQFNLLNTSRGLGIQAIKNAQLKKDKKESIFTQKKQKDR